jgi:hypothetical protein
MRVWFSMTIGTALLGLTILSVPVFAQQKTVRACQEEWRANKAENQAKGITEKAYVAQCRAGGSTAQPTPTPAATPARTPSAATSESQKTVKACREEWRANKAAYQAARVTERAYVDKCRAGETVALPAPTASPSSAPSGAAPSSPTPSATTPESQKTVKACREEWRANKAAYQAARVTERAYVDKCRAGETVALPAPTASPSSAPSGAAPSSPTPSATTSESQKTVKACREEWRANKAAYQAAKVTEKAYVDKCRAGETVALPAPTAAPSSAPSEAASPSAPAAPPSSNAAAPSSAPATKPSPTTATPTPTGAGQFQTEAQAKAHCPADIVVWANLSSRIYHFAGYKSYGNTKHGAYMCEREATTQGFRASKTETRPSA